jgi:hypothetical protein
MWVLRQRRIWLLCVHFIQRRVRERDPGGLAVMARVFAAHPRWLLSLFRWNAPTRLHPGRRAGRGCSAPSKREALRL